MSELRAELIENVQFIYELALAELELEAFGVEFNVKNSLREFILQNPSNIDLLLRRLAYFKTVGDKITDYYRLTQYTQRRSVNQYLTHWIYPYKGKFHPQMIRALLNILKVKPEETVLDSFIGSGTTAVEAQLMGINCIGIDASPLCVLQSKVKTESVHAIDKIKMLEEEAATVFKQSVSALSSAGMANKDSFREFLDSIDDEQVRNFYKIAKLVAVSDCSRRRRNIIRAFDKNLALMVASVEDYRKASKELGLQLGSVEIKEGDARQIPLDDNSVQGIVTSPPYSIALDYVSNDAHAFEAMDYDLDLLREKFVGLRGKGETRIELYDKDMRRSFQEMHRVLEQGRHCAIVIGNATYQKRKIRTIEFTVEECKKLGFTIVKNINKIIYGLYNVMQTDNTLIFRKDN